MGVKIDFSDVDSFFDKGMNDMQQTERKLAQDAVDYAKQMGTYKDVTGTLRNSNKFEVDESGVTLYNDAQSPQGVNYASFVEAKGYEVLSQAALFLEKNLKEEFER